MALDIEKLRAAQVLADADFAANRQGLLSETQAARIRTWVLRTRLLVGFALLAGVVLSLANTAMRSSDAPAARIAGLVGSLVFAAAMLAAFEYFFFGRTLSELKEGRVIAVEGPILRVYVAFARPGFAVWVNGRRYGSTRTALGRALRAGTGEKVRLYVLPRSGIVVAAEPI